MQPNAPAQSKKEQPVRTGGPDAPAAVFDVEGTLIDCARETLESWRLALHEAGHAFSMEQLHPLLGMDAKEMARKLLPPGEPDKKIDKLVSREGEIYRSRFLKTVRAFPGVYPLFENLKKRGYRIALATTCDREELRHYLHLTGVAELVDACDTGESVRHGKPHPDLLLLAMEKLLVKPPATTAIGGTPYDAEAAARARVKCIGTLGGGFPRDALQAVGCGGVVEGPEELNRRLDEFFPIGTGAAQP
jgi:phosphoglycolate phosphatase-like HAD superfamily hydrolase